MNLTQVINILPAFIGVLGGVTVAALTALFSIRNYRRQKETDRKGAAYERYLTAHADYRRLAGVEGKETEYEDARLKYSQAVVAVFPVASDKVVETVMRFDAFIAQAANPDPEEGWTGWIQRWKQLYATMIYEMRKDVFIAHTVLDTDQLVNFLPWYFDQQDDTSSQQSPQGPRSQNT